MGNTPIIRLQHMVDEDSAEILVKFEGLNVGGSIKTRTAYNMILDAENKGLFGEKARRRKEAKAKLAEVETKMNNYPEFNK